MQYHVIVRGVTINHPKFIMKLQVKQLDEATRMTIANALLEYYAPQIDEVGAELSSTHELSARIAHGELILCEWQYDAPHDDVQVLGKQEKGGEQWN